MYVLNTKKEKENKVIIYKKTLRTQIFFLKPYIYTHTPQYINFKYKQKNNNLKFYLLLFLYSINQIYCHINL